MGSSSLKENILTLGDEQFTGENLNQLKSENTSVKIVNVSSGQRYNITDTSYELIVFEQSTGKLDKTITIQSDDTGSFILPNKNVVLVLLKGTGIKNWGDYNWNNHATDVSTSLSYKEYDSTANDLVLDSTSKKWEYLPTANDVSTSVSYNSYLTTLSDITFSTSN